MFLVFLFFLTIYITLIAESYHQSKKIFKKPIKISRNYGTEFAQSQWYEKGINKTVKQPNY